VDAAGLDPLRLCTHKAARNSVAGLPGGRSGGSLLELLEDVDLVLEAAPTNLETGQPGLALVEAALEQGLPVVLASKGPLVVGWPRLSVLSDWRDPERPALRFSGAVGGGLPSLNMGWRDLAGARIQRVEAVLNLTNQLLLARMADGLSLEAAMGEAKAAGVLEADPSLDVDGWDAAIKVAALTTVIMGIPLKPQDVDREGIREITAQQIADARQNGKRWKLVCTAKRQGPQMITARVRPEQIAADSPLYAINGTSSYVQFESDVLPGLGIVESNPGPETTAYGLLADLLNALRGM